MDSSHFDRIVSHLGRSGSRRGAVRLLIASTLAGQLVTSGTDAKKRKKKKGCRGTSKGCNRCAREVCRKGRCGCAPKFKMHVGVCGLQPECKSVGLLCTSDFECCSDECIPVDGGDFRCNRGTFQCLTDYDCVNPPCRGYMCPEQYQANVGDGC